MIAKDTIFISILFYVGKRENPRRISTLSQFKNRIQLFFFCPNSIYVSLIPTLWYHCLYMNII